MIGAPDRMIGAPGRMAGVRAARVAAAAWLAGCCAGAAWAQTPAGHSRHDPGRHGAATAAVPVAPEADFARFRHEMDQTMTKMMRDMHAPGYTGNVDADFLAMMIPHHQGAIDMARLALIHGRDPLVRQLAGEIIAGQATEIAAMRARLARLRQGGNGEPDGFPALGATRGPAPDGAAPAR